MVAIDQLIEGDIETLAFGGEGILRYQGFVVFVPYTSIGDTVVCRIREVKRSFAKGTLVEVKKAGKDRTDPRCPYFGTCGGCQLQHLTLEAQLKYKLNSVHDALKRIGHLSFPPFTAIPASTNWAYRRHVTLHLRPKETGFEAGYIGQDHHSLVAIQECSIFTSLEETIIPLLQKLVKQLPNPGNDEGRATLLKNQHGRYILSFQFGDHYEIQPKIFQTALQQSPQLAGILIQTPQKEISLGNILCEEKFEGLTFRFSPQTFIQNHPEQSALINRQICRLASLAKPAHFLDLYCGFGMASLLAAQQGLQVTGIEFNPHAVQFANENASLNHLTTAHFLQGDVEKVLPRWLKNHQASFILVNPPRHGLAKGVVKMLLQARPQSILYVSCMPSTLARDLQLLNENYRIDEGFVYDMFPQTAHVETLVSLRLKK